jgi:hypothetical protein
MNASGKSQLKTMRSARDSLVSIVAKSESEIGSLARTFQGLANESNRILGLASKIVECIEDDGVTSVLPAMCSLGSTEIVMIESRQQATYGILEAVATEMGLLRQLTKVTRSQSGIALKTRVLAMMTNVEVGRLGNSGISFGHLASELSSFSGKLSKSTDDLEQHTENRSNVITATNRVLVSELPRLAEYLTRIKIDLGNDLAVLELGMARLGSIPTQFQGCVRTVAAQISGTVAAIQSYDITRQQIEHVQQALSDIEQEMHAARSRRRSSSRVHPAVAMGITIQIYQLRQIRETVVHWICQARDCLEVLMQVSASDMASISPMVQTRESEISARLHHMELMGSESKAQAQRICRTVGEHSSLVDLIHEQSKAATTTRQTLHLLSLNAIVEGERLGAQANAVLEIGHGISDLTREWSRITDQSDQATLAISELVDRINHLTATFSESEDQKLQQAQTQARASLRKLRAASDFAARQSSDIQRGLESIKLITSGIIRSVDLLEASYRRIDCVLGMLASVHLELDADLPEALDERDAEMIKRRFSASYTTEIEREVLQAALGGAMLPAPRQVLEGNAVELF